MGHNSHVHIATVENISHNYTLIDHHDINGNPEIILIATHNWSDPGHANIYNNHHIGVWYNASRGKWAVFNQDQTAMPVGAAFNLSILSRTNWSFIHPVTRSNTVSHSTYIDNPLTNGKPNVAVFVTPLFMIRFSPPLSPGIYNNHALGVWYDTIASKWAIFNQDRAEMPFGGLFNVEIVSPENYPSFYEHVIYHVATSSNTRLNYSYFSILNGDNTPEMGLIVTQNYNPRGRGGAYNNHAVGLFYKADIGRWAVYNEDLTPMPIGAGFNVRE